MSAREKSQTSMRAFSKQADVMGVSRKLHCLSCEASNEHASSCVWCMKALLLMWLSWKNTLANREMKNAQPSSRHWPNTVLSNSDFWKDTLVNVTSSRRQPNMPVSSRMLMLSSDSANRHCSNLSLLGIHESIVTC